MLLNSRDGRLHLLPALPKAWAAGEISGLVARGGIRVDIAWADGMLTQATLTPMRDQDCRVVLGTATRDLRLVQGRPLRLTGPRLISAA